MILNNFTLPADHIPWGLAYDPVSDCIWIFFNTYEGNNNEIRQYYPNMTTTGVYYIAEYASNSVGGLCFADELNSLRSSRLINGVASSS